VACKDGNSVRQKIISNILSSGVEKVTMMLLQLISTIIIIRLLPRDDYGVIGIVVGYFAFVSILNISLESVILRDHQKFDKKINLMMQNFLAFNIYKAIFFIFIAILMSFFASLAYENSNFKYAIWSMTFIILADSITAPFIIYFTSKFNQKLVTKISILRFSLSLILLLGLFVYPNIWYIALKDFIISAIYIGLWIYIAKDKLKFKFKFKNPDFIILKESFFSYSLWSHLIGVVANIMYRADTVFLSLFFGLQIIGGYNISLNAANYANIIPSIVNYQNSVALSNTNSMKEALKITKYFFLLSLLIGSVTILGYYYLGEYFIYLLTGSYDVKLFSYMMWIVISVVIIKTFGAPAVSLIAIKGLVKDFFINVSLPVVFLTILLSYLSINYKGIYGLLFVKVFVSCLITVLTYYMFNKIKNYKKEL
jgi:O-antigen/teichoic acid export membrane protein